MCIYIWLLNGWKWLNKDGYAVFTAVWKKFRRQPDLRLWISVLQQDLQLW